MMGGLGGVRVGTITVDSEDPHRLGGFWSALLGVPVVEVGEDYAELAQVSEDGPNLLFLAVPEPKAGKNRLHLDLVVTDVKSAVDSALDLGARRVSEGELAGPFPWTVMADPEGNEFCLCPPDCPGPSAAAPAG
jgi:predicted enzyme related to lactoylglutathione lyase